VLQIVNHIITAVNHPNHVRHFGFFAYLSIGCGDFHGNRISLSDRPCLKSILVLLAQIIFSPENIVGNSAGRLEIVDTLPTLLANQFGHTPSTPTRRIPSPQELE